MASTCKIVQTGNIWSKQTTREILWLMMKLQKVHVGVLHIVSNDKTVDGYLSLINGMFVLGASTQSGEKGYIALKILLKVSRGSFEYLDYSQSDLADLDQELQIRVTQLINLLPNLPEKADQLQGPNTLNRIRAMNIDELVEIKKVATSNINSEVLQQIGSFEAKSMPWRAVALWGTFALISLVLAGAHFLGH